MFNLEAWITRWWQWVWGVLTSKSQCRDTKMLDENWHWWRMTFVSKIFMKVSKFPWKKTFPNNGNNCRPLDQSAPSPQTDPFKFKETELIAALRNDLQTGHLYDWVSLILVVACCPLQATPAPKQHSWNSSLGRMDRPIRLWAWWTHVESRIYQWKIWFDSLQQQQLLLPTVCCTITALQLTQDTIWRNDAQNDGSGADQHTAVYHGRDPKTYAKECATGFRKRWKG